MLVALAASAIAFVPAAFKSVREDRRESGRVFALIFAALCPLSLVLYAVTAAYFGTGLAVRYTAPFYVLLSVIAGIWAISPRAARLLASVLAAGSIAF